MIMHQVPASLNRMTQHPEKPSLTLLGLGAMGSALARTWLAAGHPLTVWNRSPARAAALAAEGARVADSATQAVAANSLVITCLLDNDSVGEALDGADLARKDLVNLTTSTPAQMPGPAPRGRASAAPATWTAGSWPSRP